MVNKTPRKPEWILFFYSVPSKPVKARVRIWRRLIKRGAVQLKGAVYILPYSDENHEFCQWLISEVISLRGEGAFVVTENIETINMDEIIGLFKVEREKNYRQIEKELEELEGKISSIRKGSRSRDPRRIIERLGMCIKQFDDIKKIDFFPSKLVMDLENRIKSLEPEIRNLADTKGSEAYIKIIPRQIEDYQGKIWITRKGPFVDRMASAWLIKRFIDKNPIFTFTDAQDAKSLDKKGIAFDIKGGEFTHIGDMCTFEVLVRSLGIKERSLKKIAEIVHEIDIGDERRKNPEAKGIEAILKGIRKKSKDDLDALEKGMAIFEMFYESNI